MTLQLFQAVNSKFLPHAGDFSPFISFQILLLITLNQNQL